MFSERKEKQCVITETSVPYKIRSIINSVHFLDNRKRKRNILMERSLIGSLAVTL